jgi:hypothetical protein
VLIPAVHTDEPSDSIVHGGVKALPNVLFPALE